MPYFKDTNGGLHFLSDADLSNGGEALLPAGSTPIDDAAADAIQNPPKTAAQLAVEHNDPIKQQLTELDGKSIRTLHEAVLALSSAGITLPAATLQRLHDLENQKAALRAQLAS